MWGGGVDDFWVDSDVRNACSDEAELCLHYIAYVVAAHICLQKIWLLKDIDRYLHVYTQRYLWIYVSVIHMIPVTNTQYQAMSCFKLWRVSVMVLMIVVYNLLINWVYWGYNPPTSRLITSWDICFLPQQFVNAGLGAGHHYLLLPWSVFWKQPLDILEILAGLINKDYSKHHGTILGEE